jgi:hypothetical protein
MFSNTLKLTKGRGTWKLRAAVDGEARDLGAIEGDRTMVAGKRATDAVHQRGLARAIGADDPQALAIGERKTHFRQGGKTAETFAHLVHFEKRPAHRAAFRRNMVRASPSSPCGAATTNRINKAPTINTLSSDDTVTLITCCVVASRIAPITGPSQLEVPPITGIASADTA